MVAFLYTSNGALCTKLHLNANMSSVLFLPLATLLSKWSIFFFYGISSAQL